MTGHLDLRQLRMSQQEHHKSVRNPHLPYFQDPRKRSKAGLPR